MVYVLQMPLVILSCISHLAIALLAPTQIPSISSASFLCLNDKMQEASTRLHTKSRLRPESLCDPSRAKKHQDHSGTEPRRSQGVFFRTWGGSKIRSAWAWSCWALHPSKPSFGSRPEPRSPTGRTFNPGRMLQATGGIF